MKKGRSEKREKKEKTEKEMVREMGGGREEDEHIRGTGAVADTMDGPGRGRADKHNWGHGVAYPNDGNAEWSSTLGAEEPPSFMERWWS